MVLNGADLFQAATCIIQLAYICAKIYSNARQ